MRVATARTCPVISSPARCRSRCMPDAASSSRNTSVLLSSHVRLGTWQVSHPPAPEPSGQRASSPSGTGAGPHGGGCLTAFPYLLNTQVLQHVFQRLPGRDRGARRAEVDHVGNRSIYIQSRRGSMVHGAGEAASGGLQPPVTMMVTCHYCWGSSHAGLTVQACRVVDRGQRRAARPDRDEGSPRGLLAGIAAARAHP